MTDEDIVEAFTAQCFNAFWRGHQVAKSPLDLWIYQEILWETRPEILLETGTCIGGSALFFASIFDMLGQGMVVSVDKDPYPNRPVHPRIHYLVGDSVSAAVVESMAEFSRGKRTMVALDSLHTYQHVAMELLVYAPFVTAGCYLVVEDINPRLTEDEMAWGTRAVREFLVEHPDFTVDVEREKFLITCNTGGWLRRT